MKKVAFLMAFLAGFVGMFGLAVAVGKAPAPVPLGYWLAPTVLSGLAVGLAVHSRWPRNAPHIALIGAITALAGGALLLLAPRIGGPAPVLAMAVAGIGTALAAACGPIRNNSDGTQQRQG